MVGCPTAVLIVRQFRVTVDAVLQSSPYDGCDIQVAVSISHYGSEDGSWRLFGRSAVVLSGACHKFYLVVGEPKAQLPVGTKHLA